MKKMKKSLKYVLISLAIVCVVAAAVVATVLLVRKPTGSAKVEQFTAEQRILLNKLIQNNTAVKNESTKTLVETSAVSDENGEVLSQDSIYAYYNNYFVALDDDGNKLLYVESTNGNINVNGNLIASGKLPSSAKNVTAVRVFGNYLLFSYDFIENEKNYTAYSVADFSNLSNLTIVNTISFEVVDEKLYDDAKQVNKVDFDFYNDYFEVSYLSSETIDAMADADVGTTLVKKVYFYGTNETAQTFEYQNADMVLVNESKSANGNVVAAVLLDGNAKFSFVAKDEYQNDVFRTFSYLTEANVEYKFYATNVGVFIQKKTAAENSSDPKAVLEADGKKYVYEYDLFDIDSMTIKEYGLEDDVVYAEFASIDDYVVIFAKTKDYRAMSEMGILAYLDSELEVVVSYQASSIDSKILYANNERFVTNDGIYATNKAVGANKVFSLITKEYEMKIISKVIDADYFAIEDLTYGGEYIISIEGEIMFDGIYVSVVDFGDGYFLTTKDGKRHLCNPSENLYLELEGYSGFYDVYLPQFGFYLIENEINGTYSLYNHKNECIESDVKLEVTSRENFVSILASKKNYEKLYVLRINQNLGEDVENYYSGETEQTNSQTQPLVDNICEECGDNISHLDIDAYGDGDEVEHVCKTNAEDPYSMATLKISGSTTFTTTVTVENKTATSSTGPSLSYVGTDKKLITYTYPTSITLDIPTFSGYSEKKENTSRCCDLTPSYISSYSLDGSYSGGGKTTINIIHDKGQLYGEEKLYGEEIKIVEEYETVKTATGQTDTITFSWSYEKAYYYYTIKDSDGNVDTTKTAALEASLIMTADITIGETKASYQPQEKITYSTTLHYDTPYYGNTYNVSTSTTKTVHLIKIMKNPLVLDHWEESTRTSMTVYDSEGTPINVEGLLIRTDYSYTINLYFDSDKLEENTTYYALMDYLNSPTIGNISILAKYIGKTAEELGVYVGDGISTPVVATYGWKWSNYSDTYQLAVYGDYKKVTYGITSESHDCSLEKTSSSGCLTLKTRYFDLADIEDYGVQGVDATTDKKALEDYFDYKDPTAAHYIFRGWQVAGAYELDNTTYTAYGSNTDASYVNHPRPGGSSTGVKDSPLKHYDGYALGVNFGTTAVDIYPIWEGVELTIRFYVSKHDSSSTKLNTTETKIKSIDLESTSKKGITIQDYDDLTYNSELPFAAGNMVMEQIDQKIKNPKPEDLIQNVSDTGLKINKKYCLISENYVLTGWQLAAAMSTDKWVANGINLDCSDYNPDDYYSTEWNRVSTALQENTDSKSYVYVVPSFSERNYGFRVETSNKTESDLSSLDSTNNLTLNQAHNESITGYVSNETIVNDTRTYEGNSSYIVSTISIKTKDEQGNNVSYPEMYYAFTTVTIKGYKYSHDNKTDNYTDDFNHIFVYDYFEKKWSKFAFGIGELNAGAKNNLAGNVTADSDGNKFGTDIILITESNAAEEIGDVTRYSTSAKLVLKIRTYGSDVSGVASNDYGMLGSVIPGALQPVYEPYHDINVELNGINTDTFTTSYGDYLSGFDIFNAGEGDYGTTYDGYKFEIIKNNGVIQYTKGASKSITIGSTTSSVTPVDFIKQQIPKTSEGDQNIPKDDGVVADGDSGAENYEYEDESTFVTKNYTVDYKSQVVNPDDESKTSIYCMAVAISYCDYDYEYMLNENSYLTDNLSNITINLKYGGSVYEPQQGTAGMPSSGFKKRTGSGQKIVIHPLCTSSNSHTRIGYLFSWGGEGDPNTWTWGVEISATTIQALGVVEWKQTNEKNLIYNEKTMIHNHRGLSNSVFIDGVSKNNHNHYYAPLYTYSDYFTYIFKAETKNEMVNATTYDPTAFVNNSKVVAIEPKYVDVSKSDNVNEIININSGRIISTYLSQITVAGKTIKLSNILDYHVNGDSTITNKWQDRQTSDWTEITDYNTFGKLKYTSRDLDADKNVGEQEYNIILGQKFETDYGEIMIFVGRYKPPNAQSPYEYKYVYFLIFDANAVNSYNKTNKTVNKNTLKLTMTNIDFGVIERDVTGKNSSDYNETSATNLSYQNSYNSNLSVYQVSAENKSKNITASAYNDAVLVENLNVENFSYIKLNPKAGFLIEEIKIELIPKNGIFTNSIIRTYTIDYNNKEAAVELDGTSDTSKFTIRYIYEDTTSAGTAIKYLGKETLITDLCYFLFAASGTNQTLHGTWAVDGDTQKDGTVWLGFSKLLDEVKISYKVVSYFDAMMKQAKNIDVESYLKYQNHANAFDHDDYQSDLNLDSVKKKNSWFNDTTLTQIYLKDIDPDRIDGAASLYLYTNNLNYDNDPLNFYNVTRPNVEDGAYASSGLNFSGTDYTKLSIFYNKIVGYLLNGTQSYFYVKLNDGTKIQSESINVINSDFDNNGDTEVSFDDIRTSMIKQLGNGNKWNINKYALHKNTITATYYSDPVVYTLNYGNISSTIYYDKTVRLQTLDELASFPAPNKYEYSEKQGYSFVGWVSNYSSELVETLKTIKGTQSSVEGSNNSVEFDSNYGYLFTDEKALAALIGSSWYFGRTSKGVAKYLQENTLIDTPQSDFYIDGGRLISDTSLKDTENYNFWGVKVTKRTGDEDSYDSIYFKDDGTGVLQLYPVWMANDYTLKFTLNDVNVLDDDGSPKGTTETLFRVNESIKYSKYLKNYNANLNNGFNFELYYAENPANDLYHNLKLIKTENCESTSEFYVYVRYDTSEWYFSNADGNRQVYYQDLFIDGKEVNADRYGYSFVEWLIGYYNSGGDAVGNAFANPQKFDEDFYSKCKDKNNNSLIVELENISGKVTFDYFGNPNYKPSDDANANKVVYTYGKNGVAFNIDYREDGAPYKDDATDLNAPLIQGSYYGTKIYHFVTNRYTDEAFRTVSISATWLANEYLVKVDHSKFNFVDGESYAVQNPLSDSAITYTFDAYLYNKNESVGVPKYYESSLDMIEGELAYDYLSKMPYRHGYDFAGWTLAFNQLEETFEKTNDILELKYGYQNYWYEQLYYELKQDGEKWDETSRLYQGLCDDLLRYYNYYKVLDVSNSNSELNNEQTFVLHYGNREENLSEMLGDVDKDNASGHYIVLYSNWIPMLYSVEVDLNVSDDFKDISSELFAGLFEPEKDESGNIIGTILDADGTFDDGIMTDSFAIDNNGIASFNYMIDNKTYKAIISNFSFKFYYGMQLSEAFVEFEWEVTDYFGNPVKKTAKFNIADLYVKLNNNKFNGWLLQVMSGGAITDVDLTSIGVNGHINLNEKYFSSFADDWRSVSNYGSLEVDGELYQIYRDAVVEDFNEVIDPSTGEEKENIITERLYVEIDGKRYYLTGIDHIVNEEPNKKWNFSDEYLMVKHYLMEDQEEGEEYYLYETVDGAYYIYNAYEEVYDADGNLIRKYDSVAGEIYEYNTDGSGTVKKTIDTVDDDGKVLVQNLVNLLNEDNALSSIFDSNSKLEDAELTVRNQRIFRIVADFGVIANALYDLKLQNKNNSSTAKLTYEGKQRIVYYMQDWYCNAETDEIIKAENLYVLDDKDKYSLIIIYYFPDADDELDNSLYFGEILLNFNEDYLTFPVYTNGGFENNIYFDESEEKLYFYDVAENGLTFKHYLYGDFKYYYYDSETKTESYIQIDDSEMKNFHHFTGLNEYANPGLTGIYDSVELTEGGNKVTTNTRADITENPDGTYNQEDFVLNEFSFDTQFDYNSDAKIELIPYYNGRYLTEISFDIKHIFEDEIIRKSNSDISKSKYVDVRLIFDLFWDSENRTIGVEKVELWRLDEWLEPYELIWSINRKDCFNLNNVEIIEDTATGKIHYYFIEEEGAVQKYGYLDWWKNIGAIDEETSLRYDKLLDFLDSYFEFMFDYNQEDSDFFIIVGNYIEDAADGRQGRKDYNPITLNLKKLKKDIALGTKFSVQTYDVNLYTVLNDTYNSPIQIEGEAITTPYNSKGELEADIDYTTSSLSKDYRIDVENSKYPKYATIVDDSNEDFPIIHNTTPETELKLKQQEQSYNVPYGFFAFGYALASNYVGERPIDTEDNKKLINNPFYGFRYIYQLDLYDYANSDIIVNSQNSDLINSSQISGSVGDQNYEGDNLNLVQNSPMLGSPDKFLQSVRADLEVLYYSFGGLFFIDSEEGKPITFRSVTSEDETSYINKNYHIYAYYYARTTASETGFYAWDDKTSQYQRIEDVKDGYAYYSIDMVDNFVMNSDGTFTKTGSGANTLMYTFKETGVDTETFASNFNFVYENDLVDEDTLKKYKKEYLEFLELVAQTYWFICNDGEATLAVDIGSVTYDEASDMYKTADGTYYALKQNRGTKYYGAALYKKATTYGNGSYYTKVSLSEMKSYDPAGDSIENYQVFYNYYVLVDGEYYLINIYQDESSYYNPYYKHSIDNVTGKNKGNWVEIDGVTYYFNYDTLKLYEPGMIGVEVSDFSYEIVTPVNENYNISVAERSNGYGLYGITLNTIPDSSVAYWMPGTEFLFWAGITEEDLNSLISYEADGTSSYGKIYTAIVDEFKKLTADEYKLNELINELEGKLKEYTFEQLIRAGILVKGFEFDETTKVATKVELQFVVDLGAFTKLSGVSGASSDYRIPVNISAYFDILEAGAVMKSSLYAVQIYQKVDFSIGDTNSVDADNINKTFFELYGDTIYYYCEENDDIVRFAYLTAEENFRMKNAKDKVGELNAIISENLADGLTIDDIVKKTTITKEVMTDEEGKEILDGNGKKVYKYTCDGYFKKELKLDDDDNVEFDQYGNAIYEWSYDLVYSSSSEREYLWAFYYKANMPEGSIPYVVAVAEKG